MAKLNTYRFFKPHSECLSVFLRSVVQRHRASWSCVSGLIVSGWKVSEMILVGEGGGKNEKEVILEFASTQQCMYQHSLSNAPNPPSVKRKQQQKLITELLGFFLLPLKVLNITKNKSRDAAC